MEKASSIVAESGVESFREIRMGKRLRRTKFTCSCISPCSTYLAPHSFASSFSCYEDDIWTEIAKFLDGRSLVMLAVTSKWFHRVIMEDSIWRSACLRDLQVRDPGRVSFKWSELYSSAFDGSHSYAFRQNDKHIDWMRIGAFSFNSPIALVTERLSVSLKFPKDETVEKMLQKYGYCMLKNIKTGIWIADLQLVRCPLCDLNTCEGTMQTLDARHIELFLNEGYQNGSWDYQLIGSHEIRKKSDAASGAILDISHFNESSTTAMFDLKSWSGKKDDLQPKAMVTFHAVAVCTNLQKNDGLHIKLHVMRDGDNGEIMGIRISQQLL